MAGAVKALFPMLGCSDLRRGVIMCSAIPQFRNWRIPDSGVFGFKILSVFAVSWSQHSESRCFVFMRFGVYAAFVIPFPHCSDCRNLQTQISAFSKTARFAFSDLRTTKSVLESDPAAMTDLRRDAAPNTWDI